MVSNGNQMGMVESKNFAQKKKQGEAKKSKNAAAKAK